MDELPELPRTIKKREASITPRVLEWFRRNYKGSCAIEIKATNGNTVSPSAVKPHQIRALLDVEGDGLAFKMPDSARTRMPFDAFFMQKQPAYVVVCFTKKGLCLAIKPENWHGARIDTPCEFSFHP